MTACTTALPVGAYPGYPQIGLIRSPEALPSSQKEAGRRFASLTGSAFTSDPGTQRALEVRGYSPSAILLGSQPEEIPRTGQRATTGRRETVVFCTTMTAPHEYGPQYLPAQHDAIIRNIAGNLGIRIAAGRNETPDHEPTIIEYSVCNGTGTGMIWMRSAGTSPSALLLGAVTHVRCLGATVLRLHLPLSDPGTPAAAAAAEDAGFVFAGVLPAQDGLVLLLQHLQDERIDTSRIHMGSLAGEYLLANILA